MRGVLCMFVEHVGVQRGNRRSESVNAHIRPVCSLHS